MSRQKNAGELVIPLALVGKVGAVVVVIVTALVIAFGDKPLEAGNPAPAAAGTTIDGAEFDLAAHRGQRVFVNVWATWCGPCVHELPALVSAAQKHKDVVFVGLADEDDSSPDEMRAAVAKFGIPYPIVPVDDALERRWQIRAFPTSFLVDRAGNIVWMDDGAVDEADLDAVFAAHP